MSNKQETGAIARRQFNRSRKATLYLRSIRQKKASTLRSRVALFDLFTTELLFKFLLLYVDYSLSVDHSLVFRVLRSL